MSKHVIRFTEQQKHHINPITPERPDIPETQNPLLSSQLLEIIEQGKNIDVSNSETSRYLRGEPADKKTATSLLEIARAKLAAKQEKETDSKTSFWQKISDYFSPPEPVSLTDFEVYELIVQDYYDHDTPDVALDRTYHTIPDFETNRSKLEKTIEAADRKIRKNPNDAEAFYERGKAEFRLALRVFKKINYEHICNTENMLGANSVLNAKHAEAALRADYRRLNVAKSNFDKAIESGSENPDLFLQSGLWQLVTSAEERADKKARDSKIKLAGEHFDKALSKDDSLPWAHHFNSLTKKAEAAQHELLKEVKHHPNADSYTRLGLVTFRHGKNRQALKYFEEAYKIDPSKKMLNLHIGRTHLKLQHVDEALEYFEQEIALSESSKYDLNPRHEAYIESGLIYLNHKNNPEKAAEIFDALVSETPRHKGDHHKRYEYKGLALMAHAQKHEQENPPNFTEAKELMIKAEEEFFRAVNFGFEYEDHIKLAHARISGRGFDEAVKYLDEKLKNKNSENLLFQKSVLLLEASKLEEAKLLIGTLPELDDKTWTRAKKSLVNALEAKMKAASEPLEPESIQLVEAKPLQPKRQQNKTPQTH